MPQMSKRTASFVVIGTFDVRSFTPMSLVGKEVISLTELVEAEAVTLLPGKVVSFDLKTMKIAAQSNRLQLEASAPPYIRIVDVVSKSLRDNKEFPTRVVQLGMNLSVVCMLDDFQSRDRLGRRLAPLEGWGKWGDYLKKADAFPANDRRHPGMTSITMRLPMSEDRPSGWMDVKVEPTLREVPAPEIVIHVNDHYQLSGEEEKLGDVAEKTPLALLEIAEARFDSSMQRSDEVINSILEQAK